jgi:putative membrane protein
MNKKIKDFTGWFFKGMGMGAADVVPGVSGGTIAFITGIYEKLIYSIKSINLKAFQKLLKEGFTSFWSHINGRFLLILFAGIATSVVSLAKIIETLLLNYPILVWSFFFGLIIASAIFVAKKIDHWNAANIFSGIAGVGIAYFITVTTPAETTEAYWFVVLSGALAICAMILPGISGSFILLLLGKYQFVLNAVNEVRINILLLLALGAAIGLLSFSNLLSWLLKKFHNLTIAMLAGFMVGSLNKIWPWKINITTYLDSHGEVKPLLQKNVLPNIYEQQTGFDSQLFMAIIMAVVGFLIIWQVEKIANKNPDKV